MVIRGETDAVQREVRIAARQETIFPFFTDPEKMMRWKGISVTLDPKPGGVYRVSMNDSDIASGHYVAERLAIAGVGPDPWAASHAESS